jgi:hypothetical protein
VGHTSPLLPAITPERSGSGDLGYLTIEINGLISKIFEFGSIFPPRPPARPGNAQGLR